MADMQAAAQRKMRFKGKYAGPDKFKGVIPEGYKGKAKGKYFGKDSRQGANVERTKPAGPPSTNLATPGKIVDEPKYRAHVMPTNGNDSPATPAKGRRLTPEERAAKQSKFQGLRAAIKAASGT